VGVIAFAGQYDPGGHSVMFVKPGVGQ